MNEEAAAVLAFWLGDRGAGPPDDAQVGRWFASDPALDEAVRSRFGATVERALAGELDGWGAADAASRVALIVLLDQFPRNLFREDPRAFAGDPAAMRWARLGVAEPIGACHPIERYFVLLPFMHSEDLADQEDGVAAFHAAAANEPPAFRDFFEHGAGFAERHRVVIERFGRFPHRNAVLGRASTPDEQAHLEAHPSGF